MQDGCAAVSGWDSFITVVLDLSTPAIPLMAPDQGAELVLYIIELN